ncbi:MAG: hypothetical protein CMJ25_13540 [Phycisphaerae bacterium]|nr:hypothetical protein [Phycisphaerae bacterium]|tara:strand:- start:51 stop:488 length:438 start_codon:yes stop_codon:yes gene_type:complete
MSFDPLTAALDVGKSLIEKIWPDPVKQSEEIRKLQELHQKGDLAVLNAEVQLLLGQINVNAAEAKHKSIFVAGWRPFVGWVCGFGLLYASVIEPLMRFIATVNDYTGTFPVLDTTITMQVLIGMLGLGVMRTKEKQDGTHKNSLK